MTGWPAIGHLPVRPLWLCRACGAPWPCGAARLRLLTEYADDRVTLCVRLGVILHVATADLLRLRPNPGPEPAALFDRFLAWARPRVGR